MGSLWLYLAVLPAVVCAQQTIFPAAIPLALRSPHLSMWYNCPAGAQPLSNSWPLFWTGATNGWGGKLRVDGLTYTWMGNYNAQNGTANVTGVEITPTRTIFAMQAGPMNLTVTFLSPIEPSDWVNQSTPFSYMSVEVQSLNGGAHHVQLYSEIGSQFVSGINDDLVRWQSARTSGTMYHETEPQNLQPYAEISQQAEDGRGYFATALRPGLTWQIDTDVNTRAQFDGFGNLTNIEQTTFGPMGQPWYVFSFAVDLGTVQSTSAPVTWAVGYVRDPLVQYTTPAGSIEVRRPYWTSRYSDVSALIDAFIADYPAAYDRAVAFDNKLMSDAAKISSQYVDLVSLVARQVMGAVDITIPGASNTTDATDVQAFMKDIGTSNRVNPVERLFTAFPAYLYLNASLGGALLRPLLELQDIQSGLPYAAQDIGISYPNATGPHGPHQQGVEQTGNMLIMMYAHARVSGDGTLLAQHYNTAKRWADYLVENTLTPTNQATADGQNNPNMTNLAIKGIIGVKAMAKISRAMQQGSDAEHYDGQASALVSSWLLRAQSEDQQHLLGQYGQESSWAMFYNIYADVLLGTNLIPRDILAKQTEFYKTLLQTKASPLGIPTDDVIALSDTSSTAWTLFTSATVTDDGVRDQLIQYAWNRASFNKTPGEFPDVYNAATGDRVSSGGGSAGPALGAMFAHLALSVPNATITVPDLPLTSATSTGSPGSGASGSSSGAGTGSLGKSHAGAIAGGVVGGVAFIAVGAATLFCCRRRGGAQRSSSLFGHKKPSMQYALPYPYSNAHQHHPNNAPGVVGSSKAQERARLIQQGEPMSPSDIPATGPRAPALQQPGTAVANHLPATIIVGLRAEVENLRRLMQGFHEERLQPPPAYTS